MADTVLIASPDHLAALKGHSSFAGAQAFVDADALKALEVITKDKPKLIILERAFAATSRGAALIKRIKADPALVRCEIKIVAHDGSQTAGKKKSDTAADAVASAAEAAARATAAPPTPAKAPLDQRGTRRAPRFLLAEEIEVLVDGNQAVLVNLSTLGAQLVSATVLKPGQRVRMALFDTEGTLRINAAVAWASFEIPPDSIPRYRAGIEFIDANPKAVDAYCARHKK